MFPKTAGTVGDTPRHLSPGARAAPLGGCVSSRERERRRGRTFPGEGALTTEPSVCFEREICSGWSLSFPVLACILVPLPPDPGFLGPPNFSHSRFYSKDWIESLNQLNRAIFFVLWFCDALRIGLLPGVETVSRWSALTDCQQSWFRTRRVLGPHDVSGVQSAAQMQNVPNLPRSEASIPKRRLVPSGLATEGRVPAGNHTPWRARVQSFVHRLSQERGASSSDGGGVHPCLDSLRDSHINFSDETPRHQVVKRLSNLQP